jgi:hypothetical protein
MIGWAGSDGPVKGLQAQEVVQAYLKEVCAMTCSRWALHHTQSASGAPLAACHDTHLP